MTGMIKQPMLAAKLDSDPVIARGQLERLKFPVLASPKIDGIRAHVYGNTVFSRKNKPIPNTYVQKLFGIPALEAFDGELCIGKPNSIELFNRTQSGVMSFDGQPDVYYHVFDYTDRKDAEFNAVFDVFHDVYKMAKIVQPRIKFVYHAWIHNIEDLLQYEEEKVLDGYEGIMIRDPKGGYKQGRSTLNQGWLIKVKRFEDAEAEIMGVYEQETNNNVATISETGKSKRSSHKENKSFNGHLGGFFVKDIKSGIEFDIGTFQGITKQQRYEMWQGNPAGFIGKIVKYKFFPVGVKDKPRHPILLGFRDLIDM